MGNNKLLHVLLMASSFGACTTDSDKDSSSELLENVDSGIDAPQDGSVDEDASNPIDSGLADNVIAKCGPGEMHACGFAGEVSAQEACDLVAEGMDLCCCWAPEEC
tara:strand:- start:38348 stop:38665 length:318 start_codon:yes stop_codon:yes gene_type:complete